MLGNFTAEFVILIQILGNFQNGSGSTDCIYGFVSSLCVYLDFCTSIFELIFCRIIE